MDTAGLRQCATKQPICGAQPVERAGWRCVGYIENKEALCGKENHYHWGPSRSLPIGFTGMQVAMRSLRWCSAPYEYFQYLPRGAGISRCKPNFSPDNFHLSCAGWLWGGHAEDMLVECTSKCCYQTEPLNSRMVRFNGSLMLAGEFERHSGEICAFELQQRLAVVCDGSKGTLLGLLRHSPWQLTGGRDVA